MTKQPPSQPWLALQVVPALRGRPLVISIPKRIVPLSTRRSRLKRLVRETLRIKKHIAPDGYAFRFIFRATAPQDIDLAGMTRMVELLLSSASKRPGI